MQNRVTLALGVVIAVLLVSLFHFHGVTDYGYEPTTATHSIFTWLSCRWVSYSPGQNDFPYGWAAPLVSLWMIWRLRPELAHVAKRTCPAALGLVVLALLLHWVGARAQQTRISLAAFLLLLWSIPLAAFGPQVARRLLLPVAFLVFAMQFDFLDLLARGMRLVAALVSAALVNGLGVPCQITDGTTLHAGAATIALDGRPGGLRSAMALAAVAVMLAWLRQRGLRRQLLLVGMIPVIVVAASVLRTILFLTAGPTAGHDVVYYGLALALLLIWHRRLQRAGSTARSSGEGAGP